MLEGHYVFFDSLLSPIIGLIGIRLSDLEYNFVKEARLNKDTINKTNFFFILLPHILKSRILGVYPAF